jgi:hypothetical protein
VTEGGKKKLEDTTQELRDTVDGTVGSITDGLSGAVETLLPDPQPGSLLPDPQPGSLLPDPQPGSLLPDPQPGSLLP